MPVYDVQLSDGRRVSVEGEHEPTEQDVLDSLGGESPETEHSALGTAARSAALGVAPGAAAAAAFMPGMGVGAALGSAVPVVGTGIGGLVGGIVASGSAALATEFGQRKVLEKVAPQFLKDTEEARKQHPIAGAVGDIASALPSFEFAPGQSIRAVAQIPKFLRGEANQLEEKAVRGLAAQVGTQLGVQTAQTGLIEQRLPTPGELLESAATAALLGHPRFNAPVPAFLKRGAAAKPGVGGKETATETAPETGQPKVEEPADVPRFSRTATGEWRLHLGGEMESGFESKEEATHAANEILAGRRELAPDKEEPFPSVEPEKKPESKASEPDIVDEMERLAIDEGEAQGAPITKVGEKPPEGESEVNVPWGGGRFFLRANGSGADLHSGNFRSWVMDLLGKGLSKEQISEAVRSRVGEERFHNEVMKRLSKEELRQYWDSLTGWEKQLENHIYMGDRFGHPDVTPEMSAHEAIRRRLQQAYGMTVSEFAETVGRERVTLKALDFIGKMLRKTRETFGTEASLNQRSLFEKATKNIEYAKSVIGKQDQPAAMQRSSEERKADRKRYEDILAEVKGYNAKREWPPLPLMQEWETLKNKYGGMPPPESDAPAAARRKPLTEEEESIEMLKAAKAHMKFLDTQYVKNASENREARSNLTNAWRRAMAAKAGVPYTGDEPPAAMRRGKKDPNQEDFFKGTPLKASDQPDFKPVPKEERGAPDITGQKLTPEQLYGVAQKIYSDPGQEKDFKTFHDWLKRNVGPSVTSKGALQIWADVVAADVLTAPGAKLNELVESLGLEHKVYPFKRVSTKTLTPIPQKPGAPKAEGTVYTRVEIPDETAPPPDPRDLPLLAAIRIKESIPRDQFKTDEEWTAAVEKTLEQKRREWLKGMKPEDRDAIIGARERIMKGRKLRDKALSAIYQKLVIDPDRPAFELTPSDVNVDDLAWSNPNTKEGVWRTIRPDERRNIDKMRAIVSDEARRFNFDPVSHSRRLLVLKNKNTDEIALVSAYPHGRSDINVVEPAGGTGVKGKPYVRLSSIWHTWEPIISPLRSEPTFGFRKNFRNIEEFNRYLGKDAARSAVDPGFELTAANEGKTWDDVPEWIAQAYEEAPRQHDVETGTEGPMALDQQMQRGYEGKEAPEEETSFRPGTRVMEGEGGSFMGPAAGQFKTRAGQLRKNAPLSGAEVMALTDWLLDPQQWESTKVHVTDDFKMTNRQEMAEAVSQLIELARTDRLKPRQWNAVSALRKAAAEQYRRDKIEFKQMLQEERASLKDVPKEDRQRYLEHLYEKYEPTPAKSAASALDALWDAAQNFQASKASDFIAATLGRFTRPARPTGQPTIAQVLEAKASKGVSRELTAPEKIREPVTRFPLPRTAHQTEPTPSQILSPEAAAFAEQQAAAMHPYDPNSPKPGGEFTTPSGKGKVMRYRTIPEHDVIDRKFEVNKDTGQIEVTEVSRRVAARREVGPAAMLRSTPEVQKAMDELRIQRDKLIAPITRSATNQEINATMDGADRMTERYANASANNVRLASAGQQAGKKQTLWQKFKGGPTEAPEAKMVRRSAKAVVAAYQAAEDAEWRRVAGEWARIREEKAEAKRKHRAYDLPKEKEPAFVPPTSISGEHFDALMLHVEKGITKANEMMASPNYSTRWVGRKYLKAANLLREEVTYAREHYQDPEMTDTVNVYNKTLADHLDFMHANGIDIAGRDHYVPGRYDGEIWNDNIITWGDLRVLGTKYRMPKSFRNYYEAIAAGPYMAVNGDVADLAQHSLATGMRLVQRDIWLDSLKGVVDPDSKKPVGVEPTWSKKPFSVKNPDSGEMETHIGWTWSVPKNHQDYTLVETTPGAKPVAVRNGYVGIVKSCLAKSSIRDMPVGRQALMLSQMVKHGLVLVLDTFHPGRLLQYGTALSGKNLWGVDVGWRGGHSALTYTKEGLERAVRLGIIAKEDAAWAMAPVKAYDQGRIITTNRMALLNLALSKGLNATQPGDVLYRNAIQRIPGIGKHWNALLEPINKWTFDKITPGLVAESFIRNFERMNPKNKHLSMDTMMREVIRDMNVYYGNMGRQGIFKNPTFRDIAQIFVLAPLWQEGLIGKELRALSRATGASWALGRRGLGAETYFGPLSRGLFRGLAAYFAATQAINLVSRGHFTWQNEEDDHKLDAFIPSSSGKPGEGVWLSPLSVFGEVTHDLIRLGETKPTTWNALTQFGENKMGPLGRVSRILREGKSPQGDVLTSTGSVLKAAGKEFIPPPISLGVPARSIAHAIAPQSIGPNRPGQEMQRMLGSVGVKVQTSNTQEQQVRRLADNFVKKEGLKMEPMVFTPTEEASYAKLRASVRNGDFSSATSLLQQLRQHRTDAQILRAMKQSSQRPFTGSKANERMFLFSLNDHELERYYQANLQRSENYHDFLQWFLTQ